MYRLRPRLWLFVGIVAIAVVLTIVKLSGAEVNDQYADWYSKVPTLQKNFDYPQEPEFTNYDCQQTYLKVNRGISSPYEQHCVVSTAMGLMEKYAAVAQPQGYTTTYPIRFKTGGNPVIIPVQNQASALRIQGYSSGPGVTMGQYYQLFNHMKLKADTSGMYYDIAGADQDMDHFYRYPSGEMMRFNPGALSFSSNGRYAVIDSIWSGLVRIDVMNLTVQPFAESIRRTDSDILLSAFTRISDDGKTAAVAYNAPGGWGEKYFKVVDLGLCNGALPDNSSVKAPINCKTVDLYPMVRQTLPTLQYIANVKFANDHTITFVAGYTDAAGKVRSASYTLVAGNQQITTKQYLALGDSYISGEGALSYRDGTDTTRNQCHQSLVSYPYLLSVNFTSAASVACSGARLQNVRYVKEDLADQLIGSEPFPLEEEEASASFIPGVLLQKKFVDDANPEAVTISAGGNDIGFGSILEKCVQPLFYGGQTPASDYTCYATYEDRAEVVQTINRQFTQLRSLYEGIKQNNMGGRRVYVIGYPQVAKPHGDCGLNVQLNADEVKFAYELTAYLNSVIKRAADEAGVQYVDTEHAFDGYRLCEAPSGQAAMNGFTITKNPDGGRNFKASYHPNQRGHSMLAQTIAAQTSNLTKPMPSAAPKTNEITFDSNLSILQNVPKTNRSTRYIYTIDNSNDPLLDRSEHIQELLYAQDYSTKPNSSYTVTIQSEPRNLGAFTSDTQGNLAIDAAIPADLPAGFHTVHIYGSDIYGNMIDIQKVIYLTDSVNDSDGDGVVNQNDSCQFSVQSGQDIDQDNIDDVCDPLIAPPPTSDPNQPPEGIVWLDNAIMPITIQATSGP